MLMRGRKKEASKVKQTTIKAKQHSTPKAVTFPKKNELPRSGTCTCRVYIHVYILSINVHVHASAIFQQ